LLAAALRVSAETHAKEVAARAAGDAAATTTKLSEDEQMERAIQLSLRGGFA
jgi:hypothetical protein